MKHFHQTKLSAKKITQKLLLVLFVALNTPLHVAAFNGNVAVITSVLAEMHNSYPAPDNPAACPDTEKCRRAHQGLFNECVHCGKECEDQIEISYNNIIYGFDAHTKKPLSSFWLYKKHLTSLKNLNSELLKTIPNPEYAQEPTIVLIYPWKHFSVGTRFKHIPEHDTGTAYGITYAHYTTGAIVYELIPHENALVEIKQDAQSTRALFVKIINELVDRVTADFPDHIIPYVWGGSSFITPYKKSAFFLKDGVWHAEGNSNPYTGYDCSEFTMRMAKIAGIDFPWKTCAAIERGKTALTEQDQLQNGDIIWVPGHDMIVSNLERNELIESRGYGSGYGCVHRITLSECFDGITTYKELLERYYANQLIRFKNKQGIPEEKIRTIKLLKLLD